MKWMSGKNIMQQTVTEKNVTTNIINIIIGVEHFQLTKCRELNCTMLCGNEIV